MHSPIILALTWLSILIIINVFAHDTVHKTHDCIHDKIDHKITQQFVQYNRHPLHYIHTNKRKLLQSTQYQPIRIRPYYDPLLINHAILGDDKVLYIKSLVSASILYLQQFVKVIPVNGPLLIERCQRIWHYNDFVYNACPLSDYTQQLKCQYATIPDAHIAESWYYDPNTLKSYKYKDKGTGISDADLVLYVSQSNGQCDPNGKTLAWASICNLDQYGRPVAGTINFCPQALESNYWKFDISVTLHEIMHILAMSNNLFPYYYNIPAKRFYGQNSDKVFKDGRVTGLDNVYIVTERVKQVAQHHFQCNTLIGAPLENHGDVGTIGSHWEGKYLQSELMCGTMYSAVLYLSYFTLALMEDSGWYSIDYQYSDYFTWGIGEGCQFFENDCINKNKGGSNFNQYWCTASNENGCSYDYSTVSQCLNQKIGTIPSQFKYYIDPLFSGPQSHDYCAFRIPQIDSIHNDYEETCWDTRGNSYSQSNTQYQGIIFGSDSRCVEVKYGQSNHGYCFKHICFGWNVIHEWFYGVQILINDGSINDAEIITCHRSDMLSWKLSKSYGAYVKCPNVDTICGRTTKPFNCFWGQWSDNLHKCICSVGYIGNDCSIPDMNRLALQATVASKTVTRIRQYGSGICITNSINHNLNGFYRYDGEYEGIPSYMDDINSRSIYFMRFYSQWSISITKGDLSIYAYCTQSLTVNQMIDILYCKLWTVWTDNNNAWNNDVNINIFYCTPTSMPTINPTPLPTYLPSTTPTIRPSNNPTISPTIEPTTEPTFKPTEFPSEEPTFHPSNFPTEIPIVYPTTSPPTYNPTVEPTNEPTIEPISNPTNIPTLDPTLEPTYEPTIEPSEQPIYTPTYNPTSEPTNEPTNEPTYIPTIEPSEQPIYIPTYNPTSEPTNEPTNEPTYIPTIDPSFTPITIPTLYAININDASVIPTDIPTNEPTNEPTNILTDDPTIEPTTNPTNNPIKTYRPSTNMPTFDNTYSIKLDINNFENAKVNRNPNMLWNGGNTFEVAMITFSVICILVSCAILCVWCRYKCNCFRFTRNSIDNTIRMRSSSHGVIYDQNNEMEQVVELAENNHNMFELSDSISETDEECS